MPSMRDITPAPSILRTLGEIPFDTWQCLAELIDNSLDAFASDRAMNRLIVEPRVVVSWSNDNVIESDRQIEIIDNGNGMSLDELQDSVRAGYTSKNALDNLGLFGMGFNIATARLGEKTLILSATSEATHWNGLEIDFGDLASRGSFSVPEVSFVKSRPSEHGTRIIISKLKPNVASSLNSNATPIRNTLADIYTPLLTGSQVQITVQSKMLVPRIACVWDAARYISKNSQTIPARLEIDEALGEALFYVTKNRYLRPYEEDDVRRTEAETGQLPPGVITRIKRIHGWLGVQRYSDPNDFGIDFIRNGRKIVLRDKSLFQYKNPLSLTSEIEYPVELGTTVGGRIVGEIHIDHVPPTYQKSDFNRNDPSWYEVLEVLRGAGPILPGKRRLYNFPQPNNSPLARLIDGYQVNRAGTKTLTAPNEEARRFAERFRKGDPDYQSDDKWYEAAREADKEKADKNAAKSPPVNPGSQSSDDVDSYLPTPQAGVRGKSNSPKSPTPTPKANPSSAAPSPSPDPISPVSLQSGQAQIPQISTVNSMSTANSTSDPVQQLKNRSRRINAESHEYTYQSNYSAFEVTVWELTSGRLGDSDPGDPCTLSKNGYQLDFFFNPRHPFLKDFPTSYRDLLAIYLADAFKIRDKLPDIAMAFANIVNRNFSDSRIDQATIQETAMAFFRRLRTQAVELLSVREQEVIDCLYASTGEVEEVTGKLIQNSPELLHKLQTKSPGSIAALEVAPARFLVRLVDQFPEEFFDERFFRTPFRSINLPDPNSTERLQNFAKERILSFLKDALWVISEVQDFQPQARQRKAELARCAHSLSFLEEAEVNE